MFIIEKKDVKPYLLKGWNLDENYLEVFMIPARNSEIEDSKMDNNSIRFGVDSKADVYFWNGQVFHRVVGTLLDLFWDLVLVWNNTTDDFLTLSMAYNVDKDSLLEYIKTDKIYRESFKKIIERFPRIKYLKYDNKTKFDLQELLK